MKAFTEYRKKQKAASIPQRSAEWHAARKNSISGSEIHKWYQSRGKYASAFFRDKIHGSTFTGNAATFHGRMNEGIAQRYTEKYFKCDIHEMGSVVGCVPYHRYSPDGLGLVRKGQVLKVHEPRIHPIGDFSAVSTNAIAPLDDDVYDLVLFEFKNPYCMKKLPGGVPRHYIAQPLSGMCDIPLANYAMFVNCKVVMPHYEPRACSKCGRVDYCSEYTAADDISGSDILAAGNKDEAEDAGTEYIDGCVADTMAVGYIGLYSVTEPGQLVYECSLPTLWDHADVCKKYKVRLGGHTLTRTHFEQWCRHNCVYLVKFMPVKIVAVEFTRVDRDVHFMARLADSICADMAHIISARTNV